MSRLLDWGTPGLWIIPKMWPWLTNLDPFYINQYLYIRSFSFPLSKPVFIRQNLSLGMALFTVQQNGAGPGLDDQSIHFRYGFLDRYDLSFLPLLTSTVVHVIIESQVKSNNVRSSSSSRTSATTVPRNLRRTEASKCGLQPKLLCVSCWYLEKWAYIRYLLSKRLFYLSPGCNWFIQERWWVGLTSNVLYLWFSSAFCATLKKWAQTLWKSGGL